MPVVKGTGNRITPANSRAVDTARELIRDIGSLQQTKHENAFKIVGYPSLVYHRLEAGLPCSCSARELALGTRLNQDGKMDLLKITELVSGVKVWEIAPYGGRLANNPQYDVDNSLTPSLREDTSHLQSLEDAQQFSHNIVGHGMDEPFANEINDTEAYGDNGPATSSETLDDLMTSSFDLDSMNGVSDISCPVCMGSGYVGGFAVDGGWRHIIVPSDPTVVYDGIIDTNSRPLAIESCSFITATVVLPKGAVQVDALRVWNKNKIVPATILVDSSPVVVPAQILPFCDGLQHTVTVLLPTRGSVTHVELQLHLTKDLVMVDFPKTNQNSDLTKLKAIDDVSLMVPPSMALIRRRDVVADVVTGEMYQVMSATDWKDSFKRIHGWEVQARIIQPQELLSLLPRRRALAQQTTLLARRDANTGNNRT